ncbi:hypothetical protein GGR54DRAFT_634143 [Hypoxylon sp. NC1633]|nr:hypothetical protein GGR54DRAFT_634143 [Hypoxylon sp. NC1633]
MPTYLCHGFRWHRRSIRYFVVIQNVDDAAPEWIVARQSSIAILDQFYELFDFLPPCTHPARNLSQSPHRTPNGVPTSNGNGRGHSRVRSYAGQEHNDKNARFGNGENGNGSQQSRSPDRHKSMGQLTGTKRRDDINLLQSPEPPEPQPDDGRPFNDWSVVKFLEEFDPTDLTVVSGPWAYVADYVVRIDTSVSVAEEISRYEARMKTVPNKPMSGLSDESGRRINTFGNKKAGWFEKLRDQLQRSEGIGWYVVVCGDEERSGLELEDEESEAEGEGAKSKDKKAKRSPNKIRGFVENSFEFRLPEFLAPRTPEQRLRPRRAERRIIKPSPTPSAENGQPVIPPLPAPIQVAHKQNTVKPKSSKSSGGLRRLFLRRRADGPT